MPAKKRLERPRKPRYSTARVLARKNGLEMNRKRNARFQDSTEALRLLHDARARIDRLPPTYESDVPVMWSMPTEPMDKGRLADYAKSVIPQRLIHLTVFAMNKTFHFVNGYLRGIESGNPYVLYSMTRAQIELLAAVYKVASTIRSVASRPLDATTVAEVDRALVGFLYGNRLQIFEGLREKGHVPSDLPRTADEDWTATNIVTLVQRLARDPEFADVKQDYERLCEFLHPNLFSNAVLIEQVPTVSGLSIRIYRSDQMVTSRAVKHTLEMMAAWTDATITLVNSIDWPFGIGSVVYGRS